MDLSSIASPPTDLSETKRRAEICLTSKEEAADGLNVHVRVTPTSDIKVRLRVVFTPIQLVNNTCRTSSKLNKVINGQENINHYPFTI